MGALTMADEAPKRHVGRPPGTGTGTYRLNNKRSAFVSAVASGTEPIEAALGAGYARAAVRRTADRLLRVAAVRAAIKEAGSEKQALLEDLDSARHLAIETHDASALVEALRLRCAVLGVLK
jgi:hypothetical protein